LISLLPVIFFAFVLVVFLFCSWPWDGIIDKSKFCCRQFQSVSKLFNSASIFGKSEISNFLSKVIFIYVLFCIFKMFWWRRDQGIPNSIVDASIEWHFFIQFQIILFCCKKILYEFYIGKFVINYWNIFLNDFEFLYIYVI
jgi:hypothetical protein